MRGRALAELRQVEDRHRRRPVDHRPRHPRAAVRARRQAIGAGVGAHRLDRPRLRVGDAGQPQRRQPAVVVEPHHVARIEREPRRRQPEGRGLAADPFLEQRPAAAALGVAGGRGDGEALGGHPERRTGRAARLDAHRVVFLVGAHQLPLQRLRQLGLLRPHQLDDLGVGVGAGHEVVESERRYRPPVARLEADDALALDRVEAELPRQRRDRGARAFERGDQIAVHDVGERRDVDLAVGQPGAAAELAHEAAERDRAEPAVQPVAEPPVVGVGPDVAARREGRERPRVPGPGRGLGGGDHPAR